MRKRYNIKWRQDDQEELRRAVKNFNAKISRLEKKYPELKNALPERASIAQMKELIETRQDLNRELNSLRRFSRKGAEELVDVPDNDYNLKTTKWQKQEMTMRTAIINRKRKARLQEISEWEMKSGGKALGYTRGEFGMGKADEVALNPLKAFTPSMGRKDLNMKFRHIKKESQSTYFSRKEEMLRENYITGLRRTYNEEDIKDVINSIENMDFKEFYRTFQEDTGTMEFASKLPNRTSYNAYVEHLRSTWTPSK